MHNVRIGLLGLGCIMLSLILVVLLHTFFLDILASIPGIIGLGLLVAAIIGGLRQLQR